MSEDTYKGQATDTQSLNLYTYCQGDPVNATDPSGHMPEWLKKTLTIAAIVVVAAVAVTAVVVTAGAAGAAIGMAAGMYLGASAATAATVTTVATVGAYGVAAGIGACGVNRAVEAATGTNYGAKLMGEKAYNATEMAFSIAGAGVVSTAAYAPSSTSAVKTDTILTAGNKQDAIKATNNLPSNIQSSVKSFYKGASNKYTNFAVDSIPKGNYVAQMTKPGNVPGSYATYSKVISPYGTTLDAYKNTFSPTGSLIHTKPKL